jgi:hypothetical protein
VAPPRRSRAEARLASARARAPYSSLERRRSEFGPGCPAGAARSAAAVPRECQRGKQRRPRALERGPRLGLLGVAARATGPTSTAGARHLLTGQVRECVPLGARRRQGPGEEARSGGPTRGLSGGAFGWLGVSRGIYYYALRGAAAHLGAPVLRLTRYQRINHRESGDVRPPAADSPAPPARDDDRHGDDDDAAAAAAAAGGPTGPRRRHRRTRYVPRASPSDSRSIGFLVDNYHSPASENSTLNSDDSL